MHYTTGLLGLLSLGSASLLVERAGAARLAMMLLEASGALFAVYLVLMAVLSVTGIITRRRASPPPAHAAGRHTTSRWDMSARQVR